MKVFPNLSSCRVCRAGGFFRVWPRAAFCWFPPAQAGMGMARRNRTGSARFDRRSSISRSRKRRLYSPAPRMVTTINGSIPVRCAGGKATPDHSASTTGSSRHFRPLARHPPAVPDGTAWASASRHPAQETYIYQGCWTAALAPTVSLTFRHAGADRYVRHHHHRSPRRRLDPAPIAPRWCSCSGPTSDPMRVLTKLKIQSDAYNSISRRRSIFSRRVPTRDWVRGPGQAADVERMRMNPTGSRRTIPPIPATPSHERRMTPAGN